MNGKRLLITGGHCEFEPVEIDQEIIEKGTDIMRIAVTYENGEIFQHFGHTEQFKLYCELLENGRIAISGEAVLVAVSDIVASL